MSLFNFVADNISLVDAMPPTVPGILGITAGGFIAAVIKGIGTAVATDTVKNAYQSGEISAEKAKIYATLIDGINNPIKMLQDAPMWMLKASGK